MLASNNRRVLYVGDLELRGPADQIEQNTKRYIEEHAGRIFEPGEWIKIALTEKQANVSRRLRQLAITKLDNRYKPAKAYEAIECEALGQGVLVRLVRRYLDNLLPQPLDVVGEREGMERKRARAALMQIARRRRHEHGSSERARRQSHFLG
jgi:hypothetical protein